MTIRSGDFQLRKTIIPLSDAGSASGLTWGGTNLLQLSVVPKHHVEHIHGFTARNDQQFLVDVGVPKIPQGPKTFQLEIFLAIGRIKTWVMVPEVWVIHGTCSHPISGCSLGCHDFFS